MLEFRKEFECIVPIAFGGRLLSSPIYRTIRDITEGFDCLGLHTYFQALNGEKVIFMDSNKHRANRKTALRLIRRSVTKQSKKINLFVEQHNYDQLCVVEIEVKDCKDHVEVKVLIASAQQNPVNWIPIKSFTMLNPTNNTKNLQLYTANQPYIYELEKKVTKSELNLRFKEFEEFCEMMSDHLKIYLGLVVTTKPTQKVILHPPEGINVQEVAEFEMSGGKRKKVYPVFFTKRSTTYYDFFYYPHFFGLYNYHLLSIINDDENVIHCDLNGNEIDIKNRLKPKKLLDEISDISCEIHRLVKSKINCSLPLSEIHTLIKKSMIENDPSCIQGLVDKSVLKQILELNIKPDNDYV